MGRISKLSLRLALATAGIALLAAHSRPAAAQGTYWLCRTPAQNPPSGSQCPVSTDNPMPVTASVSVGGFTPNGSNGTPISATTSSNSQALPAGTVVNFFNDGANTAYLRLGAGSATATVNDIPIPANSGCVLVVGSNTVAAAITATSTATIKMNAGTGLGNFCYGGGGSGSGTGGAVNITQINGVTALAGAQATAAGSISVTAAQDTSTVAGAAPATTGIYVTGPSAAALSTAALQSAGNTSLASIASNMTTATPAGSNIIGKISQVDSTGADATDTTNHAVKVNVVAGGAGGGAVFGPTAAGSAAANPPVLLGGTANGTATGNVSNVQVDSTTHSMSVAVTSAVGVAIDSVTAGQTVSPVGCGTATSAPTGTTAHTNLPWCTTKNSLVVAQPTAADLNVTATLGAGSALAGKFGIDQTTIGSTNGVSPVAATTGGVTAFTLTAANSTNATNIKASAGTLYHIGVYNNSATLAWVSFYNTAGTPTCGTSIVYQTMIPANSTSGAGAVEDFALGMNFGTGIGICVTTGIAGTGSVAATSYVIGLGYK